VVTTDPFSPADALAAALVAAFPGYIADKIDELGATRDPQLEAVIAAATAELEASITELVSTAPPDQIQSPLELVRRATRPVGILLAELDVPEPVRDEQAVGIHPEDIYDLYPATSRDLGEDVWQVHLQWGIEKARLVAGLIPAEGEKVAAMPSVAIFGVALELRDEVSSAVAERRYSVLLWRNPAALEEGIGKAPELVLVHLRHPSAHEAIRRLAASDIRVIAIGERVDDFMTAGVMALGAEDVVESDRIVDRLDDFLPRIV
jgi:hypothetical protein